MARPAGKAEKNSDQAPATARRGIQSIEVGFRILDVIRKIGRPMPLKEIADACGLTVPNVHYYLVSFQKVGVVQQHEIRRHLKEQYHFKTTSDCEVIIPLVRNLDSRQAWNDGLTALQLVHRVRHRCPQPPRWHVLFRALR